MSNSEDPSALEKCILKALAAERLTMLEISGRCSVNVAAIRPIVYKLYENRKVMVVARKYSGKNRSAVFSLWKEDQKDLGFVIRNVKPQFDPTKKVECYKVWGM